MGNGAWEEVRRSGPGTGRFTVRRVRSAYSSWRASIRRTDLVLASVLVALSLAFGAYLHTRALAAARVAFAERAQRLQAAIAERLTQPFEDLSALSSFFGASGGLSRQQFRLLANPMLLRHSTVYAFEWLPVVRESERSAYEAEARATGLTDYRIWEAGPDGRPREAARRPSYVPVHYMEPPSALALGFDIAAEPGRWRIAEKARETGVITASPPFRLVEDMGQPNASLAIALYAPIYGQGNSAGEPGRGASLSGFVMAIFRVAPLVNYAVSAADASGLAFALSDAEAPGAPALAERPQSARKLEHRAGFELKFPVHFVDRWWTLDVFALPGSLLPARRVPIGVAATGVLIALFGFVVVTSLRTISRLRRQAEKVGPYRLVARLGHGAMGVVWEARHALLRRPTAVKLLAPGTGGERALARFEREVQLTAGLTHPSTIAIYDYGRTADGVFYYAMELLHGINLLQLVSFDGPLPPSRVVHLLRQACGALTEAHAAGLIHRDIKPANLMICVQGGIPDFLKILDFGLVKDIGAAEPLPGKDAPQAQADAGLSLDGSILGTPLYMAPEGMSDPSKVDARADLFALGAVGYFLLTGHSPFPGRTAIEVFRSERQGPPPPLERAAPNPVPAGLEETIRRCLAFNREERPASAEALDAMLEECGAAPAWKPADARIWWRDRGSEALAAARATRQQAEVEESGKVLILASGERARN
ncbi:MAG TPA: CHASE domain-containing protein [Thermoanaerobaculia bacterium]|nr:CHASE domain-containing protein [Thermoanaerobaculia bacterium]